MTQEAWHKTWEVTSIAFEYSAFFLAAPDFLGDERLRDFRQRVLAILAPIEPFLLNFVGLRVAVGDRPARDRHAGDGEVDDRRDRLPGRAFLGFLLIVDAIAVVGITSASLSGFIHGIDDFSPQVVLALVFVNLSLLSYLTILLVRKLTSASGKGMFFLLGAISFTISKLIAIGVAMKWLGAT